MLDEALGFMEFEGKRFTVLDILWQWTLRISCSAVEYPLPSKLESEGRRGVVFEAPAMKATEL